MISLDITTVIFLYILTSVILILVAWVAVGYKGAGRFSVRDVDLVWKCSVCSHVYVASKLEDMSVCPLCNSYNKRLTT